ncbi:hypothetical protein [Daejeonella sp.]|uniref:hypothetical protein n=1 Tax=Daejeonella sp. TaxID=2805397 RepID=UPI003982F85A
MEEYKGHSYLKTLRTQWLGYALISNVFIALSVSALVISTLRILAVLSFWWIIPLTLILSIIMIWWSGILKTRERDVARLLNQSYPALEESSELLLKPPVSLNMLERLQVEKVKKELSYVSPAKLFSPRFRTSLIILIVGLSLAFGLGKLESFSQRVEKTSSSIIANAPEAIPDKILPGIKSVELQITPPAYTRRPARNQSQFSVSAEEGSALNWQILTNQPVKHIKLIFNDNEIIPLRAANAERTRWALNRTVSKSGFYQVDVDGTLSDLYKLEVIKDQPAILRIISPSQYSSIDFGEPQRTVLQVEINDDYGINDAFISATISSGQGEGVKFRELKLAFQQNFSGAASYKLNKTIDLKALAMVPGDELYFYVQARDSRLQDSRSDMHIVTIQDTAQLMSMDGMLGGVNLVPEYFRSQRQIIIDSEKLINDRSTISAQEFNSRSNEIATDQKLLRLRYGKFLGEEDETEIGGVQEEEEGHDEPGNFGDAEKMLDAVSHKHDQAEDATYFEPELKAQLKAVLSEMWKSELQLRLYKPAEALPFEYKALRLLKDLQQKSRVYVAKTSFKPPLIKADKRLSGELDKIIQPQAVRSFDSNEKAGNSLKLTAGILSGGKAGRKLNTDEILILNDASRIISSRAAAQPGIYLRALGTLRNIIRTASNNVTPANKRELEAALQKLISQVSRSPQSNSSAPANDLTTEYFNNLRRNR